MSSRRKSPVVQVFTEPQHCSVDLRLRILSRLPFFAGLPGEAIAEINRSFNENGYQPGEVIYAAGDPAERLYVLAEGRVKLLRYTLAGKNVLLDLLASGEFFGSLADLGEAAYSDTAQAQTSCCVLSIQADRFRQILDAHPSVALKVLEVMAARLSAAQERVHQLSTMPVEKRIAHTLLRLGEKLGRPQAEGLLIDTPLSRDELAEMTGATTETTSRVMSQLQKRGLIHSGRQWVAIADAAGLAAYAGER